MAAAIAAEELVNEALDRQFPGYSTKPCRPHDKLSLGLRLYLVEHMESRDESGQWHRIFEDHLLIPAVVGASSGAVGWLLFVARLSTALAGSGRPGLRELYCRLPEGVGAPYGEDEWLYRTPHGPDVAGAQPQLGDLSRLEGALQAAGHPALAGQKLGMLIMYVLLMAPQLSQRTREAMEAIMQREEMVD
mmetsp:Transcript_129976/g.415712  ORF Transcript_129976/g.415712 Transcript_129976/m.415712 type:complete len:190 (-) Transcript_129976:75-644(-)